MVQWLILLTSHGFNPWSGKFRMLRAEAKKKKKNFSLCVCVCVCVCSDHSSDSY